MNIPLQSLLALVAAAGIAPLGASGEKQANLRAHGFDGFSPRDDEIASGDINPADLLKCIQSDDKVGCDGTETSDGGHCTWCSSDLLQKSFCTTPDAGDAMKQFIQDLQCDSDSSRVDASEDLGINPADLLTCIVSADKDGCDGTETSDGGHCTWCSSDMLQKSFCTTPDAGDAMKQFIQDLQCDGDSSRLDASEDMGINPSDLLTCIVSADKDGCDGTETSDGGHCTWCSSDMLQKSFCTTEDAGDAMKQFIQDLECDGDDLREDAPKDLEINPIDVLKCIQPDNKDECDGTETSDGGHCTWCSSDMLQKSFCTTSDAGDAVKQFIQDLQCDGDSLKAGASENLGINPADLLTCIQSTDKDGCDGTETSDGGHCTWCSSDMLQKSFCTTSDAGDAMKQFIQDLQCDGDNGVMVSPNRASILEDFGDINPGDMMRCIQMDDKDGCDGTKITNGHCAWCTSARFEQKFCVIPEAADAMKRVMADLKCDNDDDGVSVEMQ